MVDRSVDPHLLRRAGQNQQAIAKALNDWHQPRASSTLRKPSGYLGWHFIVLNRASEKVLSLGMYGRAVLRVHSASASPPAL
jgi:hypothetical protein